MASRNLASLAHMDTTASSGKWRSTTVVLPDGRERRQIFHYTTLMMELALDCGKPITHPSAYSAILWERPGGSVSDKCGLSRIRQSLLAARR